ncbi:hypothetical protein AKO1_015234 [Acrasis kona]|uniref:F-box domain-containing protein n=1 Tax=Acrasis kona TaxID=1008807 RepID=A0AAW2ZFB3_9EUKA
MELPRDILFEVFSFCFVGEVNRTLSLVCKDWNEIINDKFMWHSFVSRVPRNFISTIVRHEDEDKITYHKRVFFRWRIYNQILLHKYIIGSLETEMYPIFFSVNQELCWDCCWRVTIFDECKSLTPLDTPVLNHTIALRAFLLNFENQNNAQDQVELQILLTNSQYLEYKSKLTTNTDLNDFFVVEGRVHFSPINLLQKQLHNRFRTSLIIEAHDIRNIEDVETTIKHDLINQTNRSNESCEQIKQQWLTYVQNTTSVVEFDRFKYHQYFVGTLVSCDARIESVDRDSGIYIVKLQNKMDEDVDNVVQIQPKSYQHGVWHNCKKLIRNGVQYLLLGKNILPELYSMVHSHAHVSHPKTLTLFGSNVHENKLLRHHFVCSNKYMNRMFDEGDTVRVLARFVTLDKLIVYKMSLRGTSGPHYRKAAWDSAVVMFAISLFMMRYGGHLLRPKRLVTSIWKDLDMYISSGVQIMMGLSLELERDNPLPYADDDNDSLMDYADEYDSLSQLISKLILALLMRAIGNFIIKVCKWIWRVCMVPSTNMEREQSVALIYFVKYSLGCGLVGYAWMRSRSKLMQHVYSIMLYFYFKKNLRQVRKSNLVSK